MLISLQISFDSPSLEREHTLPMFFVTNMKNNFEQKGCGGLYLGKMVKKYIYIKMLSIDQN